MNVRHDEDYKWSVEAITAQDELEQRLLQQATPQSMARDELTADLSERLVSPDTADLAQATTNVDNADSCRKRKRDEAVIEEQREEQATTGVKRGKRQSDLTEISQLDPSTSLIGFSDIWTQEATFAAYLGYSDVGDLRKFAASHVFLEHFLRYKTTDGWSFRLNLAPTLKEIRESFLETTADDNKYPINPMDRPNAAFKLHPRNMVRDVNKKEDYTVARRTSLAYILILMVEDLDVKASEVTVDPKSQEDMVAKLRRLSPHITSIIDIAGMSVKVPKLRTSFKESNLEPYNRALCLLRYAQHLFTKPNWKRISKTPENLQYSQLCAPSDVPKWMRNQSLNNGDDAAKQSKGSSNLRNTMPQVHTRAMETVDLVDSSDSDDVEVAFKQEPEDGEQRPEPQPQPEPEPDVVIVGHGVVNNTAAAKPRSRESAVEEDDIGEDLQWQLEEAELELKAMRLRKQIAARKKAKTASV